MFHGMKLPKGNKKSISVINPFDQKIFYIDQKYVILEAERE